MANNVIELGQRQKKQTYQFAEVTDLGGGTVRTPWLDIGEYPTSCIHLYLTGASTFTADVEVSNVPTVYEVAQADVNASTIVALAKGARYVRVHWKTLGGTPGRVGAVWHGALQS